MSSPATNSTTIWCALLTSCDARTMDLSEADETAREHARQMCTADILTEVEPNCFTLTSSGSRLLLLLERLRDYSLGIG